MSYTRNEFLKLLGLSGLAAMTTIQSNATTPAGSDDLNLAMASYTLRNFKIDDVIRMTKQVGLTAISLKSMHMPLDAKPEDIKAIAGKVRAAGISLYGAGVIYMKTGDEVQNAFAYAQTAGLEMIVGVPNHDLLPLANEQVIKYNIKLAIHNHGPGDAIYPSVNNVSEKIKSLDKRIGFCIDIGHVVRQGEDPIALIERYKDRLYDMHIKDQSKAGAEGKNVAVGRGVIDMPGILKALKKINYKGHLAFEFEENGDDPMPGLAESVGYVRGVLKMM